MAGTTKPPVHTNGQKSGGDSAEQEFFVDIPEYATADKTLQKRMDALMKTIDPEDINTVIMFGNKPLEEMAKLSDRLIEVQERSNLFVREFNDVAEGMGAIDPAAILAKTGQFATKGFNLVNKNKKEALGAVAGLMTLGPLGALLGAAGGHVWKRGTEKKDPLQKVVDELSQSLLTSREMEGRLRDAKARIPAVITDVQKLGRARLEAFSELALYIGAGREYLRRMDEEIIPEAVRKSEETRRYEDSETVDALVNARNQLDSTLTDLAASRAVSFNAAATLKAMNQFLPALMGKINGHLTKSLPQWKDQIAQGGLALDVYSMAKAAQESDKFGDKLLENNAALLDGVDDMVRKTTARGAFDPEKIIDATNRLSQRFREDSGQLLGYVKNSEDMRRRLIDATDKLKSDMAEAQVRVNHRLTDGTAAPVRAIKGPDAGPK
jgi:uncharacterized protein YaaN involved in tellurite resistance